MPLVSVITATYNWSSVLRYAIRSVLWQTFQDWELLVVGDACTDDSEQVVASFGDPRIRWHNLPENTGSQAGPNNKGIELARGKYIAYLGHDDLWYFDHLQVLVDTMEATRCDFAFTTTEIIRPDAAEAPYLLGVSLGERYEHGTFAPPSSWMHKVDMVRDIGGWNDKRALRAPIDVDVLFRASEAGKHIQPVRAMTVVKFPAATRKNVYVEKPSGEQAAYAARIQSEPEFRYRELMRIVSDPSSVRLLSESTFSLTGRAEHGAIARHNREARGLDRRDGGTPEEEAPLYRNGPLLRLINRRDDIVPFADRLHLYTAKTLPADGWYLGFGWHGLETDGWGRPFRWADNDVEIVVTNPTGQRRRLLLDVARGPGVGYAPFRLDVLDEAGAVVASQMIETDGVVEVELPIQPGDGRIFRLHTADGGRRIETDSRIVNFAVYHVDWVDPARLQAEASLDNALATLEQARAAFSAAEAVWIAAETELRRALAEAQGAADRQGRELERARAELDTKQGAIDQLERFRRTSLRYWAARVRTSPKLRRWLRLPPAGHVGN